MATQAQRSAAKRNVKKAQSAAKSKQTLKKLPGKTRSALGKEAAAVRRGDEPTRRELEAEARRLDVRGRSKMGKAELDRLERAMRDHDVVIHLAAAADVGEVEAAPLDAEERNARGTAHVLEAARRTEVKRVIYASTIWVYSDVRAPEVDEEAALRPPAHFYTATKLAGELYCRSYRQLYGLEYTVLRFGIPYGPRARPAAVVPTFVGKALAGEPLTVAGDGRQSRRFVYVEDLADGVVRALSPVAADRVYNLVGSEDVTVAQVARTVQRVVGGVDVVRVPGRT